MTGSITSKRYAILVLTVQLMLLTRTTTAFRQFWYDDNFRNLQTSFRINDMQERVNRLEKTINGLSSQLTDNRLSNTRVDTNIPRQIVKRSNMPGQTLVGLLQGSNGNDIGFHAVLKEPVELQKGQTLKFDHIITRIGNTATFYNLQTGVFTCTVTGTYIFSLNILCDTRTESSAEVSIMLNNNPVFTAVSDGARNTKTQGGGTVILSLKLGDIVKPVMTSPGFDTFHTLVGGYTTSFSGYMLKSY